MTPKLKALEIVEKFNELGKDFTRGVSMKEFSKECAIISVKEIIKSREQDPSFDDKPFTYSMYYTPNPLHLTFWLNVIDEINKL